MKIKKINRLLIILNVITFALLSSITILSIHYDVPSKFIKRVKILFQPEKGNTTTHTNNLQSNLHKIYNPVKINIVMLGNSITWGVNWNELLSRTDVANRGIPCETTEDFLYRLDDIYKLTPKICFIMGG